MFCYRPRHPTKVEAFDRCQLRGESWLLANSDPSIDDRGRPYPEALLLLLQTPLPTPNPEKTHLLLPPPARYKLQLTIVCSAFGLQALLLPQQAAPRVEHAATCLDFLPTALQ